MSKLPQSKKLARPEESEGDANQTDQVPTNPLAPATSSTNERAMQTTLQQYKFVPHRPPVLPGPSVRAEASENELYRQVSKQWRTASQMDKDCPKGSGLVDSDVSDTSITLYNKNDPKYKVAKLKKKKTERTDSSTSASKKSSSKHRNFPVNLCLVESDMSRSFALCQKERSRADGGGGFEIFGKSALRRDKPALPLLTRISSPKTRNSSADLLDQFFPEDGTSERKPKELTHRGVQCTIFGNTEKTFVNPPVLNALLRALSFLLYELNREDPDACGKGAMKTLMSQTQQLLGELCSRKIDKDFNYDTTYSDSKRYEKIFEELKKLMEDFYGSNQEYTDKTEEMKRIFVEFKKKEMELALLSEKVKKEEQNSVHEFSGKEKDFKTPELTLQNKRLERDQLLAEVEFSKRDLINYQKILAELYWDIKVSQEQAAGLKKSLASKSKTDMLAKKSSTHKFPNGAKRSRSRESSDGSKKKP